ncbi:MAG: hypothetical protein PHQ01_04525, partial [Candidatus Pacebacteria bacterium]|nr:hypothetical protein [Candidatus Paceibacterota bacterium]
MYFLSKNKRITLSSRVAKCLVMLFILTYFFDISLAITDVRKSSVRTSFPVKLYCRTGYLLGIKPKSCIDLDSSSGKENTSTEIISLKERISYLESFFSKFSNADSTTATSSSVVYFLGEKGDVGPAGPQGPMGLTGPQGSRGPQGLQGERGETVYIQATSSLPLYIPVGGGTGPQGPAGVDGKDGSYITDITSNSTSTTYFIYNPSLNSTSSIIVPSSYIVSTSSTSTIIANDYNFFASSSNSNLITFQNGDDITYSFTDTPIFSSSTITDLNTTNATTSNFFSNIIRSTQGFFTDLFTKNLTASTTKTDTLTATTATITNLVSDNIDTINTLTNQNNILTSDVGGSSATTSVITSNTASSTGNFFQTIVNGVSSLATRIINSFSQNVVGNTLTTNI